MIYFDQSGFNLYAKVVYAWQKRGERTVIPVSKGKSQNVLGFMWHLKMEGSIEISIDKEKFEQDKKWDGLKGYVTNCTLTPREITENYKNLWQIEKAFRMSKTDLRIRPIYHRLRKRIEPYIEESKRVFQKLPNRTQARRRLNR